MKIITIVGARPQFVKAAVVSRAFSTLSDVQELIIHTGQHYDAVMSDIFFEQMQIPKPDYNLGIGSGPHGEQTGKMLESIESVLLAEKPDVLLVYGDTNSTLAGALAAAKIHIPVAHIEAGLRSFNRTMPEEVNRVLTDHAADTLYAPTLTAVNNLANEGIDDGRVVQSGDVMYDASLFYRERTTAGLADILGDTSIFSGRYILATLHRAENTDDPQRLQTAIEGLAMAAENSGYPVVLPLHPRTRAALEASHLLQIAAEQLKLIDPVGFFEMVELEANAILIATDSGGVQKEAYFFGVPCVTLRDETEWVELIETGWNRLISPIQSEEVASTIVTAIGQKGENVELYGDGRAAELIAKDLLHRYA